MTETKEKRDLLQLISDDLNNTLALLKEAMPMGALAYQMTVDSWERYLQKTEKGEPVAWINFATIPELFWAMDIEPVVYDGLSSHGVRLGFGLEYIDIAEQHIPDHVCSDNKVHLGMVLAGDLPHPDILVYPSSPCDSNRTVLSGLAEYCNLPSFCIDLPYFKNERAYQYVTDELKRLVSVLEELTGKKLDLDRLREVMKYSNQAHEYSLKIDKLRQMSPCPFSSMEMFLDGGLLISFAGHPDLADYFKLRYEDMKARLDKGERRDVDEKIRVVWPYGVYIPDLGVFDWLEEKYGAVSVNCMNFNWVVQPTEDLSTYDSMLRGLAEKATLLPMNREVHGPIENFIEATIDLCTRNSADCAIITGHIACKSNWAIYKLLKDRIEEELGIPLLIFEVDLFDERITSVDAVRARLEDWFETIVIPGMKR